MASQSSGSSLVSRAVQTLTRLVSFALQLRTQLIEARLNLEQFLFGSFRARLELFDVAWLETRFGNLRRFFSVTIQMNAAAIRDANSLRFFVAASIWSTWFAISIHANSLARLKTL